MKNETEREIIEGLVDLVENWMYGPIFDKAGIRWQSLPPALKKAREWLAPHRIISISTLTRIEQKQENKPL